MAPRIIRILMVAALAGSTLVMAGPSASADTGGNVPGLPRAVGAAIAMGGHHCVILDNGGLKCWGSGSQGQLGYGDTGSRGAGPGSMGNNLPFVNLGAGRTATAVVVGNGHTCALLDNGTVKCWGTNGDGQLGVGEAIDELLAPPASPINLGLGRTARALAGGETFTCALLDNGTVTCWGRGESGQLGTGFDTVRFTPPTIPVDLGPGRTATAISAGYYHTCALLDNATIKCWGEGGSGRLGYGDQDNQLSPRANPVNLGAGRTAVAVEAGDEHTCALLDDRSVRCWGTGDSGRLGYGDQSPRFSPPANPVDLGAGRTAKAIAAANQHTCVIRDDDALVCWGSGFSGQLGRGNNDTHLAPPATGVALGDGRKAVGLAAGSTSTCAVLDNGRVKCWGFGDFGGNGLESPAGLNAPAAEPINLGTGPGAAPRLVLGPPSSFVPLVPARLLDTRASGITIDGQSQKEGIRPSGSTYSLTVTGRGGVPFGVSAVALNITVSGGTGPGFVTAYPCGTPRPNASNLNYVVGQTIPNLALVKVGHQGQVCLYVETSAHLIADVTGFQPFHSAFVPLNPARLMDTRASGTTVDGQFQKTGLIPALAPQELTVVGRGGVPSNATAVVLNITASGGLDIGFVAVYPCGPTPLVSNLNYLAGQTIPNLAVSKLSASGTICLYTASEVHLIIDVAGAFTTDDSFVPAQPNRFLDTRPQGFTVDTEFRGQGLRPAGDVLEVRVKNRGGFHGLPMTFDTVILNVTVTSTTGPGFITVYPCGSPRPNASNLNYVAGQTFPNLVISKVGTNGNICLYTETPANLIADVAGAY